MSATQRLRDLIADMEWGGTSSTMLHNELLAVEVALGGWCRMVLERR